MDYLIVHGNLFALYYPNLIRSIERCGFPNVDVIDSWEINLTNCFRSGQPRVVQFEDSHHALTLFENFRGQKPNTHYFMWLRDENGDLEHRAGNAGLPIVCGDEQSLLEYVRTIPRK